MGICTYCGAVLDESEHKDHAKLSQIDHDANRDTIKMDQRTRLAIKEK